MGGRRSGAVALGIGLLVLGACDDDAAEDGTGFDAAEGFVGELEGTNAFVAVVADEDSVEVYACDGDAGIATQLTGEVDDPTEFALSNDNGEAAEVAFADGAYSGSITFADGSTHEFTTEAAEGDAGLYHATSTLPESIERAGWIVRNDGEQRGSYEIKNVQVTSIRAAPPIQGRGGEVTFPGEADPVTVGRARP
jgi:hypothetical protein